MTPQEAVEKAHEILAVDDHYEVSEKTRAVLTALLAERDVMLAIVEGRSTPPTIKEARAHSHGTRGAFVVTLGGRNAHGGARIATGLQVFPQSPQRWIALDADGRPCAWPVP